MIQRIQSIYILISLVLISLLFFMPFAAINQGANFLEFNIGGIYNGAKLVENGLPITLFIGLILLLHLAAFFLYKKRNVQTRILIFSILVMLGLFGMFYFFTYFSYSGANISFNIAVAFPLVAIILDYLAIRNIQKDEALIRSIDRIR